jgi:hypothetical protein
VVAAPRCQWVKSQKVLVTGGPSSSTDPLGVGEPATVLASPSQYYRTALSLACRIPVGGVLTSPATSPAAISCCSSLRSGPEEAPLLLVFDVPWCLVVMTQVDLGQSFPAPLLECSNASHWRTMTDPFGP